MAWCPAFTASRSGCRLTCASNRAGIDCSISSFWNGMKVFVWCPAFSQRARCDVGNAAIALGESLTPAPPAPSASDPRGATSWRPSERHPLVLNDDIRHADHRLRFEEGLHGHIRAEPVEYPATELHGLQGVPPQILEMVVNADTLHVQDLRPHRGQLLFERGARSHLGMGQLRTLPARVGKSPTVHLPSRGEWPR